MRIKTTVKKELIGRDGAFRCLPPKFGGMSSQFVRIFDFVLSSKKIKVFEIQHTQLQAKLIDNLNRPHGRFHPCRIGIQRKNNGFRHPT
ncbi:hypothetical protein SDC9_104974 [bioreactor metagenome]|uniref:Uncharacterized protein n=1 Tax=bioreactor metagenome TaxID=1076179 RepID=A0A645AY20_9ZZZZ